MGGDAARTRRWCDCTAPLSASQPPSTGTGRKDDVAKPPPEEEIGPSSANVTNKGTGVSPTTVLNLQASRVETQGRTIRKLADALDVEPRELLAD